MTYERVGPTAIVTFNRPERLNAFLPETATDLNDCLDEADLDDAVRTVVVTGAGRAFCAGADLSAGANSLNFLALDSDPVAAASRFRDPGGILTLRLLRCLKPVIAAINGPAIGIGASMTLPMDIRLASTTAVFAFPFTRRGMVPEGASSWFLPRAVGMSWAQDWICTGRSFGPQEAVASSLVRAVHPPELLMDAVLELASEIARSTAPVSVALARRMLWAGWNADVEAPAAHHRDSFLTALRGGSADTREGVHAFLDKRAPDFPQRTSAGVPHVPGWVGLT